MKAATRSPQGNLRLRISLMSGSTTGKRGLFRAPQGGPELTSPFAEAPHGDALERLGGHVTAHLRVAQLTLDELDGHLDDAQARLDGTEGEVGLEDVAGGLHLLEVDPLQRRTTEQAVAGRGVADGDAE